MSKIIDTIHLNEKEIRKYDPKIMYMDMTVFHPKRAKIFGTKRDYSRKNKHKTNYLDY